MTKQLSKEDAELWNLYTSSSIKIAEIHIIKPPQNRLPNIKYCRSINPILDLHGMNLQQAHSSVLFHIEKCRGNFNYITFITGKSGQIRYEFNEWIKNIPKIKSQFKEGICIIKFKLS